MRLGRGAKVLLVALAAVVALAGAGLGYVVWLLGGEAGQGDPVVVEVTSGQTAADIGRELADQGVVRSALAFRLVARSRALDSRLAAGTYDLETGMGVQEAIDTLLGGPREPETLRVRVEEGLTVALTLERLAEQTPHSVDDYRAVLRSGSLELPDWVPQQFGPEVREPYEGLLFPETYQVLADATPQQILQRLVNQLTRELDAVPAERVRAATELGRSRYDMLILASLVERETRVDDERDMVSAVLRNRLEREMLLQIDATVLYALGRHEARVLEEHLQVDSPYNTYQVAGLPPTPIAGFGRASLAAAFDPADSDALYYVLECGSQRHVFARTLDEHNRNVAAYRRCPTPPPSPSPLPSPAS